VVCGAGAVPQRQAVGPLIDHVTFPRMFLMSVVCVSGASQGVTSSRGFDRNEEPESILQDRPARVAERMRREEMSVSGS